jgi:two-component system OmpR family sensor kinase
MRRLFARIYLHFLGVLVVVAVASSLVFAWTARGAFVQEASGRISRHIASLVSEVFRDPAALARRVQEIHDELELDLVARDIQGRVLASAGTDLPAFTPEQLAQVRTGLRMVQPNPEWSVAIPVRDPKTGAVVGTVETSAHRRSRWRGLARPALILSLLLVMFAFTAAILARRISRPVERLTEAARRLGAGDLTARVRPRTGQGWLGKRDASSDELGDLTRAFDDMAERIERLIAGQKELMANISHELRSPLTRIRVALELLPRGGAVQTRLKDVESELDELERLIEDILTATRLEVTGLPPYPERIEAQDLLEDLAERARHDPRLGPESVRIVPGGPIELEADRTLLRRALWNLVDNAAKYGSPPVVLAAEHHDGMVALSVSDDGPGIPAEERERVLAPFYQMDRARTPGQPARGFGLGLTLAGRVAQVHHGVISIGSARTIDGSERGCRVTLTLPASAGE